MYPELAQAPETYGLIQTDKPGLEPWHHEYEPKPKVPTFWDKVRQGFGLGRKN